MPLRRPSIPAVFRPLAGLLLLSQGGCMSALTTATIHEALRETRDSLAAVAAGDAAASPDAADVSARLATDEAAAGAPPATEEPRPMSLDEAVDRAVARLQGVGELDAQTQAALLSILENTKPEDWPAAIDAFAATLDAYRPAPRPTPPAREPAPAVTAEPAEDITLVFPAAPPVPEPAKLEVVEAARPVGPEPEPTATATAASAPPASLESVEAAAESPVEHAQSAEAPPVEPVALAVRNACFVSRVRAWGVVDRFPEAVFHPGQDVIVYFELDAPAARHSPTGHTTSVDTTFRVLDPDGRQIGQWDFEPIDETCHLPRRDYFARYFIRIPETAPVGPCRLDVMVTDLVAGTSGQTRLDLEVRR